MHKNYICLFPNILTYLWFLFFTLQDPAQFIKSFLEDLFFYRYLIYESRSHKRDFLVAVVVQMSDVANGPLVFFFLNKTFITSGFFFFFRDI